MQIVCIAAIVAYTYLRPRPEQPVAVHQNQLHHIGVQSSADHEAGISIELQPSSFPGAQPHAAVAAVYEHPAVVAGIALPGTEPAAVHTAPPSYGAEEATFKNG